MAIIISLVFFTTALLNYCFQVSFNLKAILYVTKKYSSFKRMHESYLFYAGACSRTLWLSRNAHAPITDLQKETQKPYSKHRTDLKTLGPYGKMRNLGFAVLTWLSLSK